MYFGNISSGFLHNKLFHLVAVIALAALPLLEASHEFKYSKESCVDLKPAHHTEIDDHDHDHDHKTNHVENSENSTTVTPASSDEPAPTIPMADDTEKASYNITITTSENGYRRLKKLIVTITSNDTYDGYMLQARLKDSDPPELIGYFDDMVKPRNSMVMVCRNNTGEVKGTMMSPDTVLSEDEGVRYDNLTINWMAPEGATENIEFVMSIMDKNSKWYTTYTSMALPLKHFPVSTSECATQKSCFRYCVRGPDEDCKAHNVRYMATFEYNEDKSNITIVVGGQLRDTMGYLAVGFTDEHKHMTQTDVAACYMESNDTVAIKHLLLKNINDGVLDTAQGDLTLDKSDIDGDYVWCSFTREISAENEDHTNLDLTKPTFFYYFWGAKTENDFILPSRSQIKRSKMAIKYENKPFNVIDSSAGIQEIKNVTILAAIFISLTHALMC